MGADTLTGSRIRERRLISGLRQADLAKRIGISASYLNLIEHNRRRIGGKLLVALADALDVETSVLTEGAEASLIAALREAEASTQGTAAELERIDDFTARYPGWARVLTALHRRTGQLENAVESLNDRLTHDPKLAASVHEVLSTAASIRSTASILAETKTLEREWLDRFHANIDEDSKRLASSSRALAQYLEGDQERGAQSVQSPAEEVDTFFADHGYHFDALEPEADRRRPRTRRPDAQHAEAVRRLLEASTLSADARAIARIPLTLYAQDADILPLAALRAYLSKNDPENEPLRVAQDLGLPVPVLLRRLSCLPELDTGYVLCDRAGSLIWRKPVPGFSLPRGGAACPLWPVFAAFNQPGSVLRADVVQLGRRQVPFTAYATTEMVEPGGYNGPPLLRAGMLLRAQNAPEAAPPLELGSTCRLCAHTDCGARREPSVLMGRN